LSRNHKKTLKINQVLTPGVIIVIKGSANQAKVRPQKKTQLQTLFPKLLTPLTPLTPNLHITFLSL
jgi:hypothetical protein